VFGGRGTVVTSFCYAGTGQGGGEGGLGGRRLCAGRPKGSEASLFGFVHVGCGNLGVGLGGLVGEGGPQGGAFTSQYGRGVDDAGLGVRRGRVHQKG